MFRKFLLIGSFVLAPAFAFAGNADVQTIAVQAGQSQPITVTIPAAENQSPYALTGKQANAPLPMRAVQLGQGGVIWVPQAR
jgi:hypothetical protein